MTQFYSLKAQRNKIYVMNSTFLCNHILYYNSIFSFVTWPVIPARIIMFINKSVVYRLLFSMDGISLGRLIIRVRGGLAIQQSGLTDS